ncbi:MAG: hypothetical protein JRJ87_15790 [Deltaproteobacteria bacterium]|nr:hypothetical protein [Deltaproteobacteria bacterium]
MSSITFSLKRCLSILSFTCILFTCQACLIAPGTSFQTPATLAEGDYRFGVGGAAGFGIGTLPELGEIGGEGSIWLDFGYGENTEARLLFMGQTWFTEEGHPWALGGMIEVKASNDPGDMAILVGFSGVGFEKTYIFTPSIGGTFELFETPDLRLIGTIRAGFGIPIWSFQVGAYLGVDIALGSSFSLRPEIGQVCNVITDESRVGGCTFGVGTAILF